MGRTARAALKLAKQVCHLPEDTNRVSVGQLEQVSALLCSSHKAAADLILKVEPERIHTMIPGLLILRHMVEGFGAGEMIVSKYGVREGYLCQKRSAKRRNRLYLYPKPGAQLAPVQPPGPRGGADETVPALERLKFIAIFASNLDEFFMVRVGSLVDMAAVSPEEVDSKSGMRPREQLKAVYEAVPGLIEIKGQLYNRVSGLLAQEGIVDLTYDQLTQEERAQVKDYFHSVVLPILSPQIVGQRHPTPHLDNKALYITALLRSKSGKTSLGFIPLPTSLPPLFLLPGTRGRFLRLETILRQWAPTLFGKYKVEETCVISATRNADLTFDTEKFEDSEDDFRLLMTKLLKRRANQSIVRLELGQRPSQEMLALLEQVIQVETHQIYYDSAPLSMGYVYDLEKALSPPTCGPGSPTRPTIPGGGGLKPPGVHD